MHLTVGHHATTLHEHLGEARIANDQADDKRENLPRQGDCLSSLHVWDLATSFPIDIYMAGRTSDHDRKCHTLLLTEVNPLKVSADGCNPVRARHLELEVGIVGDHHELRVTYLSEQGVVRAQEVTT